MRFSYVTMYSMASFDQRGQLMANESTFQIEKIVDAELRKLALEGSKDTASIIIELNVPRQQVETGTVIRAGVKSQVPVRVRAETDMEKVEVEQKTVAARAFLESVLGSPPTWLKLARAFVANANGEQIRVIASSPLTKAIQPNRKLK